MKTNALIELLATGAEPVRPHAIARRIVPTLLIGTAGGLALFLAMFGVNSTLSDFFALPGFWIKMSFTGVLTVAGLLATTKLARPGVAVGNSVWLAAIPVLAMWAFAAIVLANAEPAARADLVLGNTWRVCPLNIALLSLPMLAAGTWALRGLAPTQLRLAGGALGLLSGALGACIYGLHCPEFATPFLSIWYVIGMLIPTLTGITLAPRLLRW
jgi:hypothetical protein